ncbi:MAG: response regulator, partial [Candidatus Melainabacteria bacterium]|nr:response regulator [Candidatus Melainabacteria bacterium]
MTGALNNLLPVIFESWSRCHQSAPGSTKMTTLSSDLFGAAGKDGRNQTRLLILLVAENVIQKTLIAFLLRNLGHSVTTAADGFEALEAVQGGNHFDVIIINCQLPLMDGLETARFIRENESSTGNRFEKAHSARPPISIIGISTSVSRER